MVSALQCNLGENTLALLLYNPINSEWMHFIYINKMEAQIEKDWRIGILGGNIEASISCNSYPHEILQ